MVVRKKHGLRVCGNAGNGLEFEPLLLAVEVEIPQLELHLVREAVVNSSGASSGNKQGLGWPRGPSKGRSSRDLSQSYHVRAKCSSCEMLCRCEWVGYLLREAQTKSGELIGHTKQKVAR